MAILRELGVTGRNAPTRKSKAVVAADFSNAGLIGLFERRYKRVYSVNNPEEFQTIFGNQINPSWYGDDAVKGFFDNLANVPGTLYVKSYVGNTGGVYDAVTATADVADQDATPETILTLSSAYREELEFSASGNRTGYTITNGSRFTTNTDGTELVGATTVTLNSVIDINVGDVVKFTLATDEYRSITGVDESANTVTFLVGLTNPITDDAQVDVLGFRLRTYRQSTKGVVTEVDTDLGEVWCTINSSVTDFYVENVFATSSWIKVDVETTATVAIEDTFPADVATVTYLANGSNGTSPAVPGDFDFDNNSFDGLPIRYIANVETTIPATQKALELYCKSRNDTPIVFTSLGYDLDKTSLIEAGNGYQRSDDVFQTLCGTWLGVTDPFSTDPNAADRQVPASGHLMALWIRTTTLRGIHYIPTKDEPLLGVNSVVDTNLGIITNRDRTDIAQAGVNLVQFIDGIGFILRNLFTPSTSTDFQFANGILMRNFIKISAEDSLQSSENTPNSFNKVKSDRDAINNFMLGLWISGTTGTVPTGETFAQRQNEDGTLTAYGDSVEVNIDPPVNTAASLQAGERNIEVFFAYPAPAGSIFINVGILLPA